MTDDTPSAEEVLDLEDPDERATAQAEAVEVWDRVMADMEATAEEYEADGWETVQLHPGDVALVHEAGQAGRTGIDVLVGDDEFRALGEALDGTAVQGYEGYRTVEGSFVYLLVAVEAVDRDGDRRVAVLYPVYYDTSDEETNDVLDLARREGRLHSYLRVLSGEHVRVVHDDPEPLLPP